MRLMRKLQSLCFLTIDATSAEKRRADINIDAFSSQEFAKSLNSKFVLADIVLNGVCLDVLVEQPWNTVCHSHPTL